MPFLAYQVWKNCSKERFVSQVWGVVRYDVAVMVVIHFVLHHVGGQLDSGSLIGSIWAFFSPVTSDFDDDGGRGGKSRSVRDRRGGVERGR